MTDDLAPPNADVPEYTQLTQVRVPLDEAADAFATRDASGRIPIIIVPRRLNRIRNEFVLTAAVVLALGIVGGRFTDIGLLASLAVPVAAALFLLGIYRAIVVRIPEAASALLMRGGRPIARHIAPPRRANSKPGAVEQPRRPMKPLPARGAGYSAGRTRTRSLTDSPTWPSAA